ncbi:hypothetical protein [Hyphobacterium indicum]|nr:hypothetical protein [Hyphobacterium indicum]
MGFIECAMQIIGDEPAHLMNFDVLVLAFQEVGGQLDRAAAL